MSGITQVRGQMLAGQHDAVIAFLDSYSKKFANKLLLKVSEAMIVTDKPKLSLFVPFPDNMKENKPPRFVYFQLSKKDHPRLSAFYKGLPHGSRQQVFINLMNHYAQLIEGNHALLESVYWSDTEEQVTVSSGVQGLPVPIVEFESEPEPAAIQSRGRQPAAAQKSNSADELTKAELGQLDHDLLEFDPLASFNVGL